MKIEIEIPDLYVEPITRWASISRTLTTAARLIDCFVPPSEDDFDTAQELRDIEPAINALHQATRDALWQQVRKRGK
jgi:hypothetical protein